MKYLYILIVVLLYVNTSQAQRYRPQDNSFGLSIGYTGYGTGILGNYNYYLSRNDFLQGGIFASFNKDQVKESIEVPFDIFSFQFAYIKSVSLSRFDKFSLNYGLGGIMGYEVINKGKEFLENGALIEDETKFLFGGFLVVELEYSVSDAISLIIKYNQYYHINSDLGLFFPFANIGIRIYPN